MEDDKIEKPNKFTHGELVEILNTEDFEGYRHNNASISKIYRFDSFETAITFMNTVANICSTLNHHPNWTNIYNRVEVDLSTHDAGGVTEKDLELAKSINTVYKSM
jgi:4a-hydroxytetrahydrobiopterin dehydratase